MGRISKSRRTASSSRASAVTVRPRTVPWPALAGFDSRPALRGGPRQPSHPDLRPGRRSTSTRGISSAASAASIAADDTLYAIDSESDDNFSPGWRKGAPRGQRETGEVWFFVPEHVSKQASGMGGFGSMGEGVTR